MAQPSPDLLQRIEALIRAGKLQESRLLLLEYLKSDPNSSRAWWLLSQAVSDPLQQIDCLERVLRLEPLNMDALERLDALKSAQPQSPSSPPPAFVESSPEPEVETTNFDTGPNPFLSAAPVQPENTVPAAPAPSHPQKKPKRGWRVLEWFLALILLGALLTLGYFYWNQRQAQAAADLAAHQQETQAVALILTRLPTLTATPSPLPSLTGTATPPVTATPTSGRRFSPTPRPTDQFRPQEGYFAPLFHLQDIRTSQSVYLEKFTGKPVLLYFCNSTSSDCQDEVNSLKALEQKYAGGEVVFLCVDSGEDLNTVSIYQKSRQLDFPVLVDLDNIVKKLYQVQTIPTHYFIDPTGKIAHIQTGSMTYPELLEQLKTILPE